MGMRIMVGLVPVLVVVVLWVTSKSSQLFLSPQLLGSPHFIFSVFNSIVLLITVTNHEPPPHDQLESQLLPSLLQPPFHNPQFNDGCEDHSNYNGDEDNDENANNVLKEEEDGDEDENEDEDGNDENETERLDKEDEDSDDGNESVRLDEEEEEEGEEDEELERRIEEFIAMVNKKWREEKLRDKLLIQICT